MQLIVHHMYFAWYVSRCQVVVQRSMAILTPTMHAVSKLACLQHPVLCTAAIFNAAACTAEVPMVSLQNFVWVMSSQ